MVGIAALLVPPHENSALNNCGAWLNQRLRAEMMTSLARCRFSFQRMDVLVVAIFIARFVNSIIYAETRLLIHINA